MDVYDRIEEALRERGMSRRELSIRAEIPPTTLNSAFVRRSGLSADTVANIARVLRVDVNYLLYGETMEDDTKVKFSKAYLNDLLKEFTKIVHKEITALAETYGYRFEEIDDEQWSIIDPDGFGNILTQEEWRAYNSKLRKSFELQYRLLHNDALMTIMRNRKLK